MALSVIQKKELVTNGGGTSLAGSMNGAITAGSLIVIGISTGVGAISSITDTLGNTYTRAVRRVNFSYSDIWYSYNVAGGSPTITANFASSTHSVMHIYEIGGATTTDPLDVTATAGGDGVTGTTPSVTSGNTTQADELVFAHSGSFFGSGTDAYSVGAGYTEFLGGNSLPTSGQTVSAGSELKIVSATGAQTATFGLAFANAVWEMSLATFKAAAVVASAKPKMTLMGAG